MYCPREAADNRKKRTRKTLENIEFSRVLWYIKSMKKVDLAAMDRAELEQFAYRTSVENDELKMRIRDYEEQLMTAKRK